MISFFSFSVNFLLKMIPSKINRMISFFLFLWIFYWRWFLQIFIRFWVLDLRFWSQLATFYYLGSNTRWMVLNNRWTSVGNEAKRINSTFIHIDCLACSYHLTLPYLHGATFHGWPWPLHHNVPFSYAFRHSSLPAHFPFPWILNPSWPRPSSHPPPS